MTTLMSKYWTGTSFTVPFVLPPCLEYAVWQTEVCPHTGRDHIQFFVVFPQRKRLSTVKNILPQGAHLEIARSPEKARLYCMKEQTRKPGCQPQECGVWSKGGSTLMNILKRPLKEIATEYPWKIRQIKELKSTLAPKRQTMTTAILLSGKTGTGKSKIANLISQFVGLDHTYWTEPTLTWYDHYDQEPLMIVDEFRGTTKVETILRLVDRYPYKLAYKGS